MLLDRLSAVNATDPSIALIDRLFLISLNARQALDFSTAYSLASLATFTRMGSKNFRSLRSQTYSHPHFQNVTTAVVLGTSLNSVSNFMAERGKKRKWGRSSLKRVFG